MSADLSVLLGDQRQWNEGLGLRGLAGLVQEGVGEVSDSAETNPRESLQRGERRRGPENPLGPWSEACGALCPPRAGVSVAIG